MGRSERQQFHDELVASVTAILDHRLPGADELTPEQVEAIREGLEGARQSSAERIAASLTERAPEMHEEHARIWQSVHEEIRGVWGTALDSLYEVLVCIDEVSGEYIRDNVREAEERDDRVFLALTGLLAQAVRTGFEVWTLLSRGFPSGAAARGRTIHELNVVGTILTEHGRTGDVASRFVDHAVVDQWRYFKSVVDAPDCDDDDRRIYEALTAEIDALTKTYGPVFRRPYGWAADLLKPRTPSLTALEELVGLDHWRSIYVEGSQAVHPTSWSSVLNMVEGAHVTSWRLTGLADPANAAMVSLMQLAHAVWASGPDVNELDLIASYAIRKLVDRAQQDFVRASDVADELEAREDVHPKRPQD